MGTQCLPLILQNDFLTLLATTCIADGEDPTEHSTKGSLLFASARKENI